MPPSRDIPRELLAGPFRAADARAAGLSYERLRSGRFVRIFHDVYVSTDLELTLELKCRAAAMVLPADTTYCGLTAARLYGLPVPGQDGRIHVAAPAEKPTAPRRRGCAVHEVTLPGDHVQVHKGFSVVSPTWLFLELVATLDRTDRVVLGDALLHRNLTTPPAIEKLARGNPGRRGVRRAVDTLTLLEPRAESPMETRLRLIIADAGLPRPLVNADVYDDWGEWIARPDLLYPQARIAIEYEGAHHRTDAAQLSHDLERGDLLAQYGYLMLRYQARHVFREPYRIVDGVGYALARRMQEYGYTDS